MEPALRTHVGRRSRWSRWPLAAALAAGLSLAVAFPAQAATDSLDQAQTSMAFPQSLGLMAQTFTAGTTGPLDRVSLASYTGFAKISISIQSVATDGTPSGTDLGSTSFMGYLACCYQFHDFSFSPAVPITKGTQYAIVVREVIGYFNWYATSWPSNFSGGQLYVTCIGCGTWYSGGTFGQDFAFKTWVSAGTTGQAPSIAADQSAVAVNEGTAPTNSGTYSDTAGNAVTVTASVGSVNKTGNSSGTWAWTGAVSDEAPSQTVTITADDGHGLTAAATFSVVVNATAPTAVIVTDPVSSPEGTPVALTGAASSPAAADTTFSYAWSVTKDGNTFSSGAGASFSFTPDDEGTYVVTLKATDDGGMTGAASLIVVGTNVAPTAKITSVTPTVPLVLTAWESVNFAGSFSDPGTLDTHVATWNFGDGTIGTSNFGPGGSADISATHTYASAGTYNVTLTVTDDDGGMGQASTQVVVQTPQQAVAAIAARIQQLSSLNSGQKNSLIAKLNAASDAIGRGDTTAAQNQLNAFLNELQADVNAGKVSSAEAVNLRAAVHAVQAALGTYNRLLQWWPLAA